MTDLVTYVTRMPKSGETLDAPAFAIACGGKGANQAVAAALLGSSVVMVGCVGDDTFGQAALMNFRAHEIDERHVRVVAGAASGVAPIFVEPNGENRILIVRGANDALAPADVLAAENDIALCDVLVVQLEVPLETVYAAAALGVRRGLQVVLNPAPATTLDPAVLRSVDILVPNQTELALLADMPVSTRDEAVRAARALVARGSRCIIVTLGADGALLVDTHVVQHVPGVAVDAVDTTGAGDAFVGSLVDALGGGRDIRTAIDVAVRFAADSVTRRGTQSSYARS